MFSAEMQRLENPLVHDLVEPGPKSVERSFVLKPGQIPGHFDHRLLHHILRFGLGQTTAQRVRTDPRRIPRVKPLPSIIIPPVLGGLDQIGICRL